MVFLAKSSIAEEELDKETPCLLSYLFWQLIFFIQSLIELKTWAFLDYAYKLDILMIIL
jgi:hypothetical protein